MAATGAKLVQYLSAASICSPSRASLMTGRAFARIGIYPGVLSPLSVGGLPLNETTLPTSLRSVGFTTAMCGKCAPPDQASVATLCTRSPVHGSVHKILRCATCPHFGGRIDDPDPCVHILGAFEALAQHEVPWAKASWYHEVPNKCPSFGRFPPPSARRGVGAGAGAGAGGGVGKQGHGGDSGAGGKLMGIDRGGLGQEAGAAHKLGVWWMCLWL